MSSQGSYVPVAFATLNGTVTITATASPGTTVISANVPSGLSINAIDVEVTDVDFVNGGSTAGYIYFQMFVSGFGLSQPIYQNIGHTAQAGVVADVGSFINQLYGNIRWFLPNGAAGVNLGAGGTVGFAAWSPPAPVQPVVGASYMIVWGVYSSVV